MPRELKLDSQAVPKIGATNNKHGKPTAIGNRNEKLVSKEMMKVTIIGNTNIWFLVELKMIIDQIFLLLTWLETYALILANY